VAQLTAALQHRDERITALDARLQARPCCCLIAVPERGHRIGHARQMPTDASAKQQPHSYRLVRLPNVFCVVPGVAGPAGEGHEELQRHPAGASAGGAHP
jgi:hypothetical protein